MSAWCVVELLHALEAWTVHKCATPFSSPVKSCKLQSVDFRPVTISTLESIYYISTSGYGSGSDSFQLLFRSGFLSILSAPFIDSYLQLWFDFCGDGRPLVVKVTTLTKFCI